MADTRCRPARRAAAVLAATLALLATTVPAAAQQQPAPSPEAPVTPAAGGTEEQAAPPAADTDAVLDLATEDAADDGTARIIVGLDVRWKTTGYDNASPQGREQQQRVATRRAGLERELRGTEYQLFHDYDDRLPFVAMEVSPEAIERLRTSDAVATVEIDEVAVPTLKDSDRLMGGDIVHAQDQVGAGQAVAILDTGVDAAHPFFGGRIVAEACYDGRSGCPGGGTAEIGPGTGAPCTFDGCDHGTHVAGIAAGHDATSSGVAPAADIVAIQVFGKSCSIEKGVQICRPSSNSSDQLAGMQHALDLKLRTTDPIPVAAVNMSLGSGRFTQSCDATYTAMKTMVDTLLANDIATVVASGNNGYTDSVSSPACISTAVTVGSTTKGDTVASYSNADDQIDLLAPGSDITSSLPGGGFGSASGTSMAAPQVAGAFALARAAGVGTTVASLLASMQSSGIPVTDARNALTKPRLSLIGLFDGFVDTCPPDDAFEDNDTLAGATPLLPGRALAGLACPGDDDVFVVHGMAGATLTAELAFDDASSDLDLKLLDETGATLASSATTADTESVIHPFTPEGETVYLRVSGATGTEANDYVLRAHVPICPPSEASESNGTKATAAPLTMPTSVAGASCNGADNASLDYDFYAVTLQAGSELSVTLRGADPLRLYLDGPSGANVAEAASDGTETLLSYTAAQTGTHHILVFPYYYSQETLYRLEVESSPLPPSTGGLFEPYTTLPAGDQTEVVAAGDVTGDGTTDVVTVDGAGTNPQMHVFPGTGSGLGTPVAYDAGPADTVDIGDLNGDGFADVVVGTGTELQVFLQDPASHALLAPVTLASSLTRKIRIGDVTGDGVKDVVGIGWGEDLVAVWVTTVSGTLLSLDDTYPVDLGGRNDLELADVNDDGRLDVVAMSGQTYATPDLSILTQTETGTLNPAVTHDLPGGDVLANGIGAGDVTGDGLTDVVVSHGGNRPTSKISVFAQNDSGTLDPPTAYDSYDIPQPVEVADIDGDGLDDVVTLHGGWSRAGVHLQQADGTLAAEDLYEIPYASHYDPHGLVVADMDGNRSFDVVIVDTNSGLVTLMNTSDAPACPTGEFLAEYFPNKTLTGTPTVVRCEPTIANSWGTAAPAPDLPADGFSVRWTGTHTFTTGDWHFETLSDDGIRLYVDDTLTIDNWTNHAPTTDTATRTLTTGDHTLRLEYYEAGGGATAHLTWNQLATCPTGEFLAEYFPNKTLTGTPTVVRCEPTIANSWGTAAPAPDLPADGFSVRWTGTHTFTTGDWHFETLSDDGIRLYVDDTLTIDNWTNHAPTTDTATRTLTTGDHTLRLEYYEAGGGATAHLTWNQLATCPTGEFLAEYFPNKTLTGTPTVVRCEPTIANSWGTAAPAPDLPADGFSVRWTGTHTFTTGDWHFETLSDDGIRLYVDDTLTIDNWTNHAPTTDTATRTLTTGDHTLRLEYYEAGGGATAHLTWNQLATCPTGEFLAEYFPNKTLTGTPTVVRCEPTIANSWGTAAPAPDLPADGFSVRWTGTHTFTTGDWHFETLSDDGIRLYVDDTLTIDNWTNHAPTTDTATRTLTTGDHTLRLEYYEAGGGATAHLTWNQLT